ncbi:MAG: L-histidine N(alpha)-methyltransferase [Firmicutes bacterium]|nr:L-histidine N(alpha)-methyltransferase [Bacillota bacterium]
MHPHGTHSRFLAEFAADVRAGLCREGQKELPSRYLYDEIGSALFEVICVLPEYGLARAGERLLRRHAVDLLDRIARPTLVVELGSGSGKKTRWLLEVLAACQPTTYYPIEISPAALARCARELGDIPALRLVGLEKEYLDGLREVAARRQPAEHLLVLFLGSTIGNFDRTAGVQFLRDVRQLMLPGDSLLLATDLEKPVEQLLLAYDDPLGVTAAFNRNLLGRINRELGADFNLRRFRHAATYRTAERRIEMHLVSEVAQRVHIPAAGVRVEFRAGETIWTESSHKYNLEEVVAMAQQTGFVCVEQWVDHEWPFAQNLLRAV